MNTQLAVVLTTLAVCYVQAEWVSTNLDHVTILMGIDSSDQSDSDFVVGAGQNGKGYGVCSSSDSGDTYDFDYPQGSLMNLAAGVSRDGSVWGLGGVGLFTRTAGDDDFDRNEDLMGTTIDIKPFADSPKGLGSAGLFTLFGGDKTVVQVNGAVVTTDGGASWAAYDLGNSTDVHAYPARYGAFPADDTWYITTGSWPTSDAQKVSRHISKTGQVITSVKDDVADGYTGAVFKTTDGGKTFNEVLKSKGEFYFNGIHCYDIDNCVVAAEGMGAAGYVTSNGGATWTQTVTADMTGSGGSLLGAYMVSPSDYWFCGGVPGIKGQFWHVTDGKAVNVQNVQGAYCNGLTFRGGAGYAAVMGQSVSGVLKYNE